MFLYGMKYLPLFLSAAGCSQNFQYFSGAVLS